MSDAYSKLGVSASKDDVHDAIKILPASSFPGAFCHLVEDPWNKGQIHAIHSDGAGTKANVAYMAFRETGNVDWFAGLAQDSIVMNLDDLICIGAKNRFIVSNTIGRNARIIPGGVLQALLGGYAKFVELMSSCGVEMILGGGETADSGDTVRTLVVDSTLYTHMATANVIDFSKVEVGDVIVGFESGGQSTYESTFNSGIGSNGFTLARHVILSHDYAQRYPETFSPEIDIDSVYQGSNHLSDILPGTDMTIAEALLSPTRSYAPVVAELLNTLPDVIKGMIHNTGGGLTKCVKFGNGFDFYKNDLFELPEIFKHIQTMGKLDDATMFRTFNCGHRFEIYCSPENASAVIEAAKQFNIAAKIIGEVRQSKTGKNAVTISANNAIHVFN